MSRTTRRREAGGRDRPAVAGVAVTAGALATATTCGAPAKRVPVSGGPYVHDREAFGDAANRPHPVQSVLVATLGG